MNDLDHEFTRNERHSLLDMLDNKNQMASRVSLTLTGWKYFLWFHFSHSLKKTILHRITIVGKLRNNADYKTRLGGNNWVNVFIKFALFESLLIKNQDYYERKFRVLQQQQQQTQKEPNSKGPDPFQEKVSGVLIIYPTLMIHVIEVKFKDTMLKGSDNWHLKILFTKKFKSSVETIKDILIDLNRICQDPDGMIIEAKILNFAHEISFFVCYLSLIILFLLGIWAIFTNVYSYRILRSCSAISSICL